MKCGSVAESFFSIRYENYLLSTKRRSAFVLLVMCAVAAVVHLFQKQYLVSYALPSSVVSSKGGSKKQGNVLASPPILPKIVSI